MNPYPETRHSKKECLSFRVIFIRYFRYTFIESLDYLGRNYGEIIQIVQQLDQKEIGDPSLQKLICNMIVQLLSWTADNEQEEIKRKRDKESKLQRKKDIAKDGL